MLEDDKWYDGLPTRRLMLYDKIYLLAFVNFKKGRYRYFDDFYSGIKTNFKIHSSELEKQLPRYLLLWNTVKLDAKTKFKVSKADYDYSSTEALAIQGKIDERSYNLLKHAKLFTKEQILTYYIEHGTFVGLERCGEKTNRLLVEVCEEWSRL